MKTILRAASAVLLVSLGAIGPDMPHSAGSGGGPVGTNATGESPRIDPRGELPRAVQALPETRHVDGVNGASAFQLVLETAPEAMSRAYLVYELAGVPHWTATVRSINGMPARGGFGAIPSSGTALQIEEIHPRWLRAGANQIQFFAAPAAERPPSRVTNLDPPDALAALVREGRVPYLVRNLRLVYFEGPTPDTPALWVTHPVNGESDAAGSVVRGFVAPAALPNGPAELFVDDVYLPHGISQADGSLAVFVPRGAAAGEAWETRIEIVYPDGTRIRRTVRLTADTTPSDGDESADEDSAEMDPESDESLDIDRASLEVRPGALGGRVKLTMRRLRREQLPAMDAGMTNVTPLGGGYRMGPHGLRFRKPVELKLPYDPSLIPKGMSVDDIRTYYFDETAGRWFAVPRIEAKADAEVIVSATDHFTDFVNATLSIPDAPEGSNYAPNSLTELAKGDPASNIVEIAAPEAGPTGDATLDFPLVVPPGRRGMEPELAVRYNSGGGNGWLGLGWDLQLSRIEISTTFGVPRYDGDERYDIDGERLVSTSGGVFVRRVEGTFQRIVRHGGDPTRYWWEVTDKDGNRAIYGSSAQSRLSDPRSGRIFRWLLDQEIDTHGNTVQYFYFTDRSRAGAAGEPWVEMYPERIEYTSGPGIAAFYKVTFTLDAPDTRPDRTSSGRPGFKTYMRHRLASVSVLAGEKLVRQYDFHYRTGDFSKSLLASIVVRGEDGSEFHRHAFGYVGMPLNGDSYDGFAAEQEWSGIGGESDFTDSSRIGGGAHVFAGLGPPGCQPHFGAQLGGSATHCEQTVSFLDVTGDGLPDRLDQNGNVDVNGYDPIEDSGFGTFDRSTFGKVGLLGQTLEWSLDVGVGGHLEVPVTLGVSGSYVWSHANDDRLLADLDGDLRPDLVSTAGGFSVRRNTGNSFATPSSWSGFGSLNLSRADEEAEILEDFHLSNPLRQLIVPFTGRVTLSGAIRKKDGAGDGVDVEIFHNARRVWKRRFAGGDTASCPPGPGGSCSGGLTIDVAAGDSLYFLSDSVRSTSGDALVWAPVVTYDGRDPNARDPHGTRTFVFDAAEDFTLAGYRGQAWSAQAEGTARVTGALVKQETSDDVVLTVSKNGTPVLVRAFAAAEHTSFDAFPPIAVVTGDRIGLSLSSRTPIDPKRIQWTPSVTYEGVTTPALPEEARTQRAQPAIAVPTLMPADTPMESWPATATGPQSFNVSCDGTAMFYVQGVNRLLASRAVSAETKFTVAITTTANEPLFFSVVGDSLLPAGICKVNGGGIPVNVRWRSAASASVLAGGHHGWFYGEWNGNHDFRPSALVVPDALVWPDDEDDEDPLYIPGAPRWEGNDELSAPLWVAGGFDLYLAAEGVKASRKGADAAGVIDDASGSSGGGLSVLRKTSGKTAAVSVSAVVGGISTSWGWNDTQLDLVDMNGDRYPDQVSESGVRYSNGTGFGELKPFPGLSTPRESEDLNISISLGLGITSTKKSGKGKVASVLSSLPSVGNAVSLTHTTTDLIDVNGDGLPDRVRMTPGEASVTVELNLGYRFGAPESWSLPPLDSSASTCADVVTYPNSALGDHSNLGSLNGLSYTRSSSLQAGVAVGPFGGGASTTLSRTIVELIDVNGDGLPDRVMKDQASSGGGDDFFRVQLNLGDGWDGERRWLVPRWKASVGNGFDSTVFTCLDAISFSGSVDWNVSAGVPICIPLVPPVPVVGLQIEVSAQAFGTISSGAQLFLEDIDGDGLADHVLKKDGSSSVYVKRNNAGKVNLLSTVERPLGSTIGISYARRGNHENMPFSQWVLSQVRVKEARSGSTYITNYDYANDAFYDRAERENYGYGHVRITLPDGSTIDRDFENGSLYTRHLKKREALAEAKSGKLFRVDVWTYDARPVAAGSRFPALVEETTAFHEGTTSAPKQIEREYTYDALGNVKTVVDRADLEDNSDDVRTAIEYQFFANTPLTRPAVIEVTDRSGKILRKRQGTYDDAGDLRRVEQTLIGGRDPESGAPYSGTRNAVSTFTYDGYGNLATSTDPSGYVSTFAYDATTRTHPAEVSDSFGYVTRYAYDLKYGALAETIDQNGNALRRMHDAFGRILRIVGPYDTDDAPALRFEYGRGNRLAWAVVRHKDVTGSGTIDSAVFIDSLARVLQTKEEAELDLGSGTSTRTGMRVSGRADFDDKGRIASEGQPSFHSSAANQFVGDVYNSAAKNPTTFTYDTLDRVRSVRFPHGAETKIAYGFGSVDGDPVRRFLTVRTDPNGRATRFYRDVADQVVAVEQTNAGRKLVTRYDYDPLEQLVAVIDAKRNTTKLEHDTLGRNVTLDNPDLGRTEFRYDPAGNLRAKITANLAAANQQIRYLYTFRRLDRIDYPQSADVVYTYGGPGAPQNRANRIVTVADESGLEERSYGKLGEIVQTTKITSSLNGASPKGPYTTRFQFDSLHRLLSVVYPDGETLTYGYDAGGQVKSATGLLKGVRFEYLRHLGYDEFNEQVRMVLGNGVETRHTYDPASRFLSQLRTSGAGRILQNLRYTTDPTGTVLAIQNDVPVPAPPLYGGPVTQTFRYDELYQLIAAEGMHRGAPNKQSTYNLAFTYDDLGNIVAKNQLHQTGNGNKLAAEKKTTYNWSYTYGGPQPHAATKIADRTYRYDANGNQIAWESEANGTRRTLSWNEENRLTAIADNGQTTRFLYDAGGTRTNKAGQHGETTYVNRWFSIRNGAIVSKHVFADQARVATKHSPDPEPPSEKVYFFQGDHLGSTQFVTDEVGTVYQHLQYFPTGEIWVDERSETQRTPHLFSGKELDEETGLSYFGFRYYDPRQGQWISADPILDELLDTEKLTRGEAGGNPFFLPGHIYGYVGNNPANLADPDGLGKHNLTRVKLSKLPATRSMTTARTKKLWTQKLKRLVKMHGDKFVRYRDPAKGRRLLDLESYAFAIKGKKAIVKLHKFGKGSTRAQHFAYGDSEFSKATGVPFDRSATMKGNWLTADQGTWHHHPENKSMAFVPREVHSQLGHTASFASTYGH